MFAEPEIEAVGLMPNDAFLVLASDGVFEFLSSQSVVDMVSVAMWHHYEYGINVITCMSISTVIWLQLLVFSATRASSTW